MFDFDATLPIMALQFLLLTYILNLVFYKPSTKALDERDAYVRENEVDALSRQILEKLLGAELVR